MLLLVVISVFGALILAMLAVAVRLDERAAIRSSMQQIADYDIESVRSIELRETIGTRIGVPALQRLVRLGRRFTPAGYTGQVAKKLAMAGRGRADDLDRFLALRVVTIAAIPVAFIVCLFVLPVNGRLALALALFATLVLVLGPDAQLNREVAERQYRIQIQLPDVLDLLTISVEAGLGFEQALDRTVGAIPGALAEEFSRMLGEVRAGATRADALRGFEERTGVADVKSFVLAILQADTFGVSIGHVLRLQADEMRVRRRQLAQERAQKAPVKMLFPMVFCIFPALFVVVLGPAVISIVEGLNRV